MKTNRYQNIRIKKNSLGKRFYDLVFYPKIEPEVGDVYVTAKSGDRLDIYAQRYYGDSRLWTIIAKANELGKGSLVVEPGTRVWIPMNVGQIQENFDNLQNNI